LRGNGTEDGIFVEDHDNVTIWGGRITYFEDGIDFEGSEHSTVRDARVDNNERHGIDLDDVNCSQFIRVRADDNDENGIDATNCSENRFFSVLCDGNGNDGLRLRTSFDLAATTQLEGSTGNKIKKCWFAYNEDDGLHLIGADENDIKENQAVANGYVGIHLDTAEIKENVLGEHDGSDHNEVARNWCPFNGTGIAVEDISTGNELHENIALASSEFDLFDDNDAPPCENTWFLDTFFFRGGDGAICIF